MTPSLSQRIKDERRRSFRVTPDPLLTICLPSGNYGIVLDVSHEGVGFLASSPLEEAATIRFEISPRSTRGPEGSGQLMWKDDTGKRGGLRFTQVSDELRTLIAQFLPRETPQTAQPTKVPERKLPRVHPVLSRKSETDAESDRRILGSDDIPDMPDIGRKLAVAAAANAAYPVDTRGRNFYANAVTLGMACLIALAIWYSFYSPNGRREALNVFSRFTHPISAFASAQMNRLKNGWPLPTRLDRATSVSRLAKPPAEKPIALPFPAQAAPSVAQGSPGVELNPTPSAEAVAPVAEKKDVGLKLHVLADPAPQAPQPNPFNSTGQTQATNPNRDPAQTQLAAARKLLQDESDGPNALKAAQLLWQAVEKGNSTAEIDLAGLYLSGRGVAKSCNQALVLLTAARNHKNALAESKLQSLGESGCGPTVEPGAEQVTDQQPPPPPSNDSADATQ